MVLIMFPRFDYGLYITGINGENKIESKLLKEVSYWNFFMDKSH